jgi:hypothetical protein
LIAAKIRSIGTTTGGALADLAFKEFRARNTIMTARMSAPRLNENIVRRMDTAAQSSIRLKNLTVPASVSRFERPGD